MTAHPFLNRLGQVGLVARTGRVRKIIATHVEADGPSSAIGDLCLVETRGGAPVLAQVAGVTHDTVVLAPLEQGAQITPGARVTAHTQANTACVGDAFGGRAIDPMGLPIDGGGAINAYELGRLEGGSVGPMDRCSPRVPLVTGVRAIDGLLPLAQGQRVGVFAAAGVGKTSLMTQLAAQVQADRCVVCLVGERGREVEAFWRNIATADARGRTTLVAATSDQTAAMRVRAVNYALALAEHWRSKGEQVLLLVDSMTRLAMALREIGLAAGEPPTVRAYTPSVFAAIPRLVERCGALRTGGSITAVMTVLSETDDNDDPVAEVMKSLLDGHIILSRSLAERGHFPAIDVPKSISRLAPEIMTPEHGSAARKAAGLLSTYEASRTLIETGLYAAGSNADIDMALDRRPGLMAFLAQDRNERSAFEQTQMNLHQLMGIR